MMNKAFRVTPWAQVVNRKDYQYDLDGSLDSFLDDGTSTAFTYDERGRLSQWDRGGTHLSYAYDPISNQILGANGTRTFGTTAGPHTVSTQDSEVFTHDAAGRRTASSKGFSASYTSFNLPSLVVDRDGHLIEEDSSIRRSSLARVSGE